MQNQPLIIDVKNLYKNFAEKFAVQNVSLQVTSGEIFGFLGPNGSGKTTTIRMLCGLLTPDQGEGSCLGFDILKESYSIKREVGYMPQRFSLYEDLSIYENLDFIAQIYNMKNRAKHVEKSLEELGLQNRSKQLAGALSGGWKQRLALATALLHEPKLLLLDEPTAGVDPKARRDFWDQIHQLSSKGITTLVSTHYMDEAERCHRLAYIMNGTLMISGTVPEIMLASQLITWQITGENLRQLAQQLREKSDEWQITAFGNTLHISYTNPALEQYVSHFQSPQWHWQKGTPNLEDIFVHISTVQKESSQGK